MNNLEEQRQANIQRNKDHLKELGILCKAPIATKRATQRLPPAKRIKLDAIPASRSSARIATAPVKPSYSEDQIRDSTPRQGKKQKVVRAKDKPARDRPPENALVRAKDLDDLRVGWTAWKPTAPPPTRDEELTFYFEDHPTFMPNKSPEEMLREGCFGGSYFRPLYSRRLTATIENDYTDLPHSWYQGLNIEKFLTSPNYDSEVNKYKVKCGQTIEEWEANGWISHEHDVRGWFQWYCRFFMGRRCDDDERQVTRWRKCVGGTGRWRRTLLKKYVLMKVREVFDDGEDDEEGDVSPVMHQTCFHWAYEYRAHDHPSYYKFADCSLRVRQADLDRFWAIGT